MSDCEAAYFTIKSFSGLLTERFSGHGRMEGGREGRKKGMGGGKRTGKGREKEGKTREGRKEKEFQQKYQLPWE